VLLAAFHVGDYIPWLSWVSYVDGTDARVTRAFQRIDRILDEIVDAAAATRETPLSGEEGSDDDAFIHVLLSLQQKKEPSPAGTTAEWRLSRDNVKALLEVNNVTTAEHDWHASVRAHGCCAVLS